MYFYTIMPKFFDIFSSDNLAIIMLILVTTVLISIAFFAQRYLQGDDKYCSFYVKLSGLYIALITLICANNLFIMWLSWGLVDIFLVTLMIHKKKWAAAYNSGILAAKYLLSGWLLLGIAFICIYHHNSSLDINYLVHNNYSFTAVEINFAMLLILITSMIQSAIFPFHKWLISSLNAPTPVSALMHAGIVNGGGLLLTKFAPLFLANSLWLNIIFTIGLFTALLGTFWQLLQANVKSMLACSTMGQMGFMLMQCGCGLFAAAIAHLCWHGFFKAYLFLSSGNIARDYKLSSSHNWQALTIVNAVICGIIGSTIFAILTRKFVFITNTNLILIIVALLTAIKLILPVLIENPVANLPFAITITITMSILYSLSINLIEIPLITMKLNQAQQLNIVHKIGIAFLCIPWGIMFCRDKIPIHKFIKIQYLAKLYVSALNHSQPSMKTISSYHHDYQY